MPIDVACAIIEHEGRVLVVQRSARMKQPLLWEFPGGKLEKGEKAGDCVVREIKEELDLSVQAVKQLKSHVRGGIRLIPFLCTWESGKLYLQEHQEARWLLPEQLPELEWCPADIPVVKDYLKNYQAKSYMSERINISSGNPWESTAGYSRAVRIGNIVEIAGTTAVEKDKVVGQGNMYEQTYFILERIVKSLEKAGGSAKDIIRTRMYVTDINLWEEAGRAHADFFKDQRPVSTLLEVPRLIRPDLLVEIEASAVLSD